MSVRLNETDQPLANPGKGWLRSKRMPSTVDYIRICWKDVEPADGQYDWQRIDRALAAAAGSGKRIAFRIMTTNAHTRGYYCAPKWLFDAGCRGYRYLRGGPDTMAGGIRIPRIEPDYSDPMFLERHDRLLKSLGDRYNGQSRIEFLDIGSYGIWGEWHTNNGKPWPWSIRKPESHRFAWLSMCRMRIDCITSVVSPSSLARHRSWQPQSSDFEGNRSQTGRKRNHELHE
jgi:hypothetical protein